MPATPVIKRRVAPIGISGNFPKMEDEEEILAVLETNGFGSNPGLTIALATVAGMGAMFVLIMINLHPLFPMVGLLGGILATFGVFAGKMEYRLTSQGLSRYFRPFLRKFLSMKGQTQLFPFSEIESYQLEKDLSRSMTEVETLKIKTQKPPYHVWINDQINPGGFRAFADAFIAQVESVNRKNESSAAMNIASDAPKPAPIQRKKGFYESIPAKLLTALFIVATLALAAAFFLDYAKPPHLIRFAIIIVPGTCYMTYRVFLRK
ncbi:hypothetical protein VSU19_10155 [Verrucomicrobiales bacterium BCK34]|nr:hypothetical protein [Verrucomicrobiales bacterium BCK34]